MSRWKMVVDADPNRSWLLKRVLRSRRRYWQVALNGTVEFVPRGTLIGHLRKNVKTTVLAPVSAAKVLMTEQRLREEIEHLRDRVAEPERQLEDS